MTLRFILVSTVWALPLPLLGRAGESVDEEQFFEKEVRPALIEHCGQCHGNKKQSSGLRVDSLPSLLEGGDTGAAIVPGDPANSLLIKAVRREGDLAMPPEEALDAGTIRTLAKWIEMGAPWPETDVTVDSHSIRHRDHWAYQPITRPKIPAVDDNDKSDWIGNEIDAFVLAKLDQHGLDPSPEADRRTLIRRVSYALTGLPPTMGEVERFLADTDPGAYDRLVDRLLESPGYGEQWARHWLDVARYSDTKGYVYAREERHWTHAWAYRDWVVKALNEDMPYDRFLLLQLAADQIDCRRSDLAAMGFLTLGRRFLGVQRDIIDDRIDVVSRGTMGLTVGCARCHDHKYDPIPTADYYSLYGVFQSCIEKLVPLADTFGDEEFEEELRKRQTDLADRIKTRKAESSERVRGRIADYLFAQSQLHDFPADGFDQIFQADDLLPAFVRRWERYLRDAKRNRDPIFAAWYAFAEIPADAFSQRAAVVTKQLRESSGTLHPAVAKALEHPPESFREVCDRYGEIFAAVNKQWQAVTSEASGAGQPAPDPLSDPDVLSDPDAEALRQVMYGPQAPCQVPDGPISHSETYFTSDACTELWKLQGEVDRWIVQSKVQAPFALTLVDQSQPIEPRIFVRGNPLKQGKDVPRQFLAALAGPDRRPFQHGSGRLELAQAIIDPENPLTARVIVNRVWAHHFSNGLVLTPSDFGNRAAPPSHPQLLDWLATQLVAENWSLKKLHRRIVLSATFRQSSGRSSEQSDRTPDSPTRGMKIDPENRFLSRMNARRLTFEEFRDSLLAAASDLDCAVGGKPASLFSKPYSSRRSLYGKVDRQYLPGTLRIFDFANPDLHVSMRSETTVPQQALFFMNDPLVLERAKRLAAVGTSSEKPVDRVTGLFQAVFQRRPTDSEIKDALALVAAASEGSQSAPRASAADWGYGFGAVEQEDGTVAGFTPLPHFTGQAWQGGPQWPDATLGWVQLTADGGHPGNDRNRAAVRRWTAPREMSVRVQSSLRHEPTQGDGIRAFVVSSARGILCEETIHHDAKALSVDSLDVSKGDTIDFVVDIGDVLNSDQFLWKTTIEATSAVTGTDGSHSSWDSVLDFPAAAVEKLDGWEQLAQVMLCANEFLFVD